ncbi:unnamed protein product [Trifolium pratense]|uniref:Uncharacterized protein n=1 Tax=Trifolium pratense TaxID=57577 RepID=A0ACB0JXA1_TRIPR|nr:unnamed protein product [Trifolium pratense]
MEISIWVAKFGAMSIGIISILVLLKVEIIPYTFDRVLVEVLLRDPTDEHVVPVVEELQRGLPKLSDIRQQQGDGKEYLGGQQDVEAAEDD